MPTPISVHRCRFVDFQPAAITALSFVPLPLPAPSAKGKEKASAPRWRERYHFGTLVVGRANGDIELCEWTGDQQVETPQAWVVRKVGHSESPSICADTLYLRTIPLLPDFSWPSTVQGGIACTCITLPGTRKTRSCAAHI